MSDPLTYDGIKEHAKREGKRVEDLLVLSRNNDPFYTGTPADLTQAKWFADLWKRFGYDKGVHLRRIHYQIVSQREPVSLPDLASHPVPEADHADEPADLLFDSSRDYFEQLTSYRKFQGRGGEAGKINGSNSGTTGP